MSLCVVDIFAKKKASENSKMSQLSKKYSKISLTVAKWVFSHTIRTWDRSWLISGSIFRKFSATRIVACSSRTLSVRRTISEVFLPRSQKPIFHCLAKRSQLQARLDNQARSLLLHWEKLDEHEMLWVRKSWAIDAAAESGSLRWWNRQSYPLGGPARNRVRGPSDEGWILHRGAAACE